MRVLDFLVLVAITCVVTLSTVDSAPNALRSEEVHDDNVHSESRKLSSVDDPVTDSDSADDAGTDPNSEERGGPNPGIATKLANLAEKKSPGVGKVILPEFKGDKSGKWAATKKILFILFGATIGGLVIGNLNGAIGMKQ